MSTPICRARLLAAAAFLVLGSAGPGLAQGRPEVSLRLDWVAYGHHTPFALTAEKGYYAENGLVVSIQEGRGSATTLKLVANVSNTFGFADSGVAAKGIVQDVPVKVVAGVLQKSPLAILSLEETGIRTPKDLEGKLIAGTAGGSGELLLPAFLKANGLAPDAVRMVTVEPGAKPIYVLQKKVHGTIGFTINDKTIMESKGARIAALSYGDHGVNVLAHGIIVSQKVLQEQPDMVRKFLAATARGYAAARANPDEAVAALKKRFPQSQVPNEIIRKQLVLSLELLQTRRTEGRPWGWMAREDWEATQDLLHQYAGLERKVPVTTFYTNEYLPQGGAR
ncbi:MAG: ABC transporter substrate-binding protein [Deltaproteobacteria bacterium]|nr:ABC transporter substrate-binding protein [Deltaproteobacteria bacterium]MBI3076103.1 ABC transporter substrate-binding protein [Deltaproteobacteria bacterium]